MRIMHYEESFLLNAITQSANECILCRNTFVGAFTLDRIVKNSYFPYFLTITLPLP